MSLEINNRHNSNMNNIAQNTGNNTTMPAFRIKNKVEQKIDEVVQHIDEEKEKPHNKTAITVGASVIGLSILVALVNPKVSSKLIEKLKILGNKYKTKLQKSKGDVKASKFYKFLTNSIEKLNKFVSYTNNVNSVKDTYYKQFCTEEKSFYGVKNKTIRKCLQSLDKGIRFVLKKPHELISKWGERLARHTVKNKYKNSAAMLDRFEIQLKKYYSQLSAEDKVKFDELMSNIKTRREYFSVQNLENRLSHQGDLMQNLNTDIRRQWVNYKKGFTNKYVKTSEHFNKNLSFWAQDIMAKKRGAVNTEGKGAVDTLFSYKGGTGGNYNAVLEIIKPHMSADEFKGVQKLAQKAEKGLRKANKSECMDYFDKRRDLTLGSAPTDILTATVGITTGAIALASADDRDKRISRTLTGILPAVAGIGTNIAMTSMLFSGTKSMLIGAATGGVMSLLGSGLDKARLRAKEIYKREQENKNA